MTPAAATDRVALSHTIDGHRYVVVLDASTRRIDLYRQLGRWAADPRVNFTWADASIMGQMLGQKTTA